MKAIRVLHFITSIDHGSGGTSTFIKLLTEQLAKEINVKIVTGISANPIPIEGVSITYFDLSLHRMTKFSFQVGALLDDWAPDIVHVNGIWELPNTVIQRSAQKRNIPVIISPHGMLEPWIVERNKLKKKLAMLLYQHKSLTDASCLHATALSERDNIRKLGYLNDVAVVENGIQIDQLPAKKSWKKTNTLLFLSRINPKKGIEFLIEAIGRLKAEFAGYRIIIAGEGDPEYISSLKKKATVTGVNTLFHFCGGVYGAQKWELYRKADLFVLPTHSENFGLVISEALACGTPVITTVGAPWAELTARNCGWWIDIGAEPLVKALKDFLSCDEKTLEEMGKNGIALVNEKYTAEAMGKAMVQLYRHHLGRNGSAGDHDHYPDPL